MIIDVGPEPSPRPKGIKRFVSLLSPERIAKSPPKKKVNVTSGADEISSPTKSSVRRALSFITDKFKSLASPKKPAPVARFVSNDLQKGSNQLLFLVSRLQSL
jgi:hypothetical protein